MSQPVVEEVSGSTYNISGSEGTFNVPGLPNDEYYWLKVDTTTGNIEIWNQNIGIAQDKVVGTLDPNTGDISFKDNRSYTVNGNEVHEDQIFSTPETQSFITSQARDTIVNDKTAELIKKGETPKVAAQMAELEATKILGSNFSISFNSSPINTFPCLFNSLIKF